MDSAFWKEIWETGNIPFHRGQINPALPRYFPTGEVPEGSRLFVPLCGKSRDMDWFRSNRYSVLGVELSERAAEQFFDERRLRVERHREGLFERWVSGRVEILVGDYFDLTPEELRGVRGIYDRAALIALPREMRREYVQHLDHILPGGVTGILLTLEHGPTDLPPFSVEEEEVRELYSGSFDLELLAAEEFSRSGSDVVQKIYRLTHS